MELQREKKRMYMYVKNEESLCSYCAEGYTQSIVDQ